MNKVYKFMILASLLSLAPCTLFTKNKTSQNKIKIKSILFTAEDSKTGTYFPSNKTAFLGENEYDKVIAIAKNELNAKSAQKSKKNKDYLGLFIDKKSKQVYYIYGVLKNQTPCNQSPDADVLTQIAIEIDYGPGE